MKHASPATVRSLARLRRAMAAIEGVREHPKPGLFRVGAQSICHFHEDETAARGDLRFPDHWEQVMLSKPPRPAEERRLVAAAKRCARAWRQYGRRPP